MLHLLLHCAVNTRTPARYIEHMASREEEEDECDTNRISSLSVIESNDDYKKKPSVFPRTVDKTLLGQENPKE